MATIGITRQTDKHELDQLGVFNWPIWEKEPGIPT